MEMLDPVAREKTTRIDLIVHEVVLCGGPITTGTLADRLIAKRVIRTYADLRYSLRIAVLRGLLCKAARGVYTLPEPAQTETTTLEPTSDPAPVVPETAAREETAALHGADLQAKLAGLLAEKRAQLKALATDQDQNLRVRAHVDQLIAHNKASIRNTEADIERIEGLLKGFREISSDHEETKPAP